MSRSRMEREEMTRLQQYQQKYQAVLEEMKAILAEADESSEDGRLTEDQQAEYDELDERAAGIAEAIAQREAFEKREREAPAIRRESAAGDGPDPEVVVGDDRVEQDPRRGFRSHREFLVSVMRNRGATMRDQVRDKRLRPLAVLDSDDREAGGEMAYLLPRAFNPSFLAAAGSDEGGGYSDEVGGVFVPRTKLNRLLQVGMEADPTAGRTQDIPMASPTVDIPARVDKDHTSSVAGGFTVTRKPETVAATSSRAKYEMVSLKASSLFGLAFATEEILTDSPISFAALIDGGFRDQFPHHMLTEKLRGLGGNEYIGVLDAANGSLVTVAKESAQAADTIVGENVINMRARSWGYGSSIWIANHDTYPQLVSLHIAGTNADIFLFRPGNGTDVPDTLLGRPIFFGEYASPLGDVGDIILANWSQFLEGLYQPLDSAESMHVRFVNHERAFKFWLRNAGAPWWRAALTPHKGANTLSPFVTLAERA